VPCVSSTAQVIVRASTMKVREGGRQAVIQQGPRNVHVWIKGEAGADVGDEAHIEIG
jgi:hypothetical protein